MVCVFFIRDNSRRSNLPNCPIIPGRVSILYYFKFSIPFIDKYFLSAYLLIFLFYFLWVSIEFVFKMWHWIDIYSYLRLYYFHFLEAVSNLSEESNVILEIFILFTEKHFTSEEIQNENTGDLVWEFILCLALKGHGNFGTLLYESGSNQRKRNICLD